MSNIDNQIKAALRDSAIDQPGIVEMAASNFRGKQRLTTFLSSALILLLIGVMVWCAMAFFQTDDVREMILYTSLFLFFTAAVAMMKLWFWLMMIRYSIARELKRLELQIGLLAKEQGKSE